jgi:hypothetical protein
LVAADLDGDVRAEILWRHRSGLVTAWFMDGAVRTATVDYGVVPSDWVLEGTGDSDGDFNEDLLWRDANGERTTWRF